MVWILWTVESSACTDCPVCSQISAALEEKAADPPQVCPHLSTSVQLQSAGPTHRTFY